MVYLRFVFNLVSQRMYLFIVSHLGSRAKQLAGNLDHHPHMCWNKRNCYKDGYDLMRMKTSPAKIWFDCLLTNEQFPNISLYNSVKFIYLLEEPDISGLVDYSLNGALRYYTYRLKRIHEMYKQAPGLLLTELGSECYEMIFQFVGIKSRPLPELKLPESSCLDESKQEVQSIMSDRRKHYLNMLSPSIPSSM